VSVDNVCVRKRQRGGVYKWRIYIPYHLIRLAPYRTTSGLLKPLQDKLQAVDRALVEQIKYDDDVTAGDVYRLKRL